MKIEKKYVIKYIPTHQYMTKDSLHPLSSDINDALIFSKYSAARHVIYLMGLKVPKNDFTIITL